MYELMIRECNGHQKFVQLKFDLMSTLQLNHAKVLNKVTILITGER